MDENSGSTAAAVAAVRARARGASRANLAGALGAVWVVCGAPGSLLLTLFLQEWLHAAKWQLGLMMTLTYLGPTLEPVGAWLAERFGRRRRLFVLTYLVGRLLFLALAVVPWLGSSPEARAVGVGVVLAVVALSRVACHLGTPAWWSWMGDLVPEPRRGRFFACRFQAVSAGTALTLLLALLLLHAFGGMSNALLASAIFGGGVVFGVLDILLYLWVPEPPPRSPSVLPPCPHSRRAALVPFQNPAFRRLIVGMGLWSFSANLVLPFLPVYQRGETLAGQGVGLGLSWLGLALLHVAASLAGMLLSRRWGEWGRRLGPRGLLLVGSCYLFVNLAYLAVGQQGSLWPLVLVAVFSGGFTAAWTVAANQLLLQTAPKEQRGYYVSAYNLTNGWLMAGGPLLGGLLADRWPLLGWSLPGGVPACYFHLLLILATAGCGLALLVLSRSSDTPPRVAAPTLLTWRTSLTRLNWSPRAGLNTPECPRR
jgi:MFS family permease